MHELQICHAPISPAVVDIIFYIFDTDEDGVLSMDEFLCYSEEKEKLQIRLILVLFNSLNAWWVVQATAKSPGAYDSKGTQVQANNGTCT
jgi:hypothetical protein